MKYVLKKIFIGVAIGIILMLFSNYVHAEQLYKGRFNLAPGSCNNCLNFNSDLYSWNLAGSSGVQRTRNIITMSDNRGNVSNFDSFEILLQVNIIDYEYTENYNIEGGMYCGSTQVLDESGTTYYADGSISNYDGDHVTCSRWNSSLNLTQNPSGDLNISNVSNDLYYQLNGSTGTIYRCNPKVAIGNSILYNCPITSTSQDKYVSALYIDSVYQSTYPIYYTLNRRTLYGYEIADKQTINAINQNTQATQQQTQTITSSDISGANSDADALKNNTAFDDSSGISSLISLPLRFINNLGTSCSPINLTIPYMDTQVQIPCFKTVISNKMPALATLISLVVNGFILYNIFIQIIDMIHGAKNPDDDRLEVVEL